MHLYSDPHDRQTFARIFRDLCNLGWDLPSHHAHVLLKVKAHGPLSLEQEYLWVRYLRDMEAETQP
jgi:hypothetical protein